MPALIRLSAAAVVVLAVAVQVPADDKETAENPYYKYWSKSKVGATVSLKESTKVYEKGPGAQAGEDVKVITNKLIELTPEKAVVETVVTEGEVFGYVQSAPTKQIYPAKMSKQVLQELLQETGAKGEKAKLKVKDKELDVLFISGTTKVGPDDTVEHKLWLSDEVPGGIVKRVRVSKFKGEIVAETTIELVSYTK